MTAAPGLRVLLVSMREESKAANRLARHLAAVNLNVVTRDPEQVRSDGSVPTDMVVALVLGKGGDIEPIVPLIRSVAQTRRYLVLLEEPEGEELRDLRDAFDEHHIFDLTHGFTDEALRKVALSLHQQLLTLIQAADSDRAVPEVGAALSEPVLAEARGQVPPEVASKAASAVRTKAPSRRRWDEERGPASALDTALLSRLSPSSRQVIAEAARLADRADSNRIHMDHLLVGLYRKQDGPAQRLFRLVDPPLSEDDFVSLLEDVVEALIVPDSEPAAFPTEPIRVSSHVQRALVAARDVADRFPTPDGLPRPIQSRHLLFGALSVSDCTPIKALLARGVRPDAIVFVEPTPAMGDGAEIAGFRSDEVKGRDLLDIRREVEALAKVIAARDVQPPLAIGLFGDWGTGKTFFMRQLKSRIDQLAAAEGDRKIGRPVYHTQIVQLDFNAWHYIEQDLWASLASAIFDGLDDALTRQRVAANRRVQREVDRARLHTKRAVALRDLARAEHDKAHADTQLAAAEARLRRLEAMFDEIARDVRPRDILLGAWSIAAEQPELRQTIEAASSRVNETVERAATGLGIGSQALRDQIRQQTSLRAWLAGSLRELFRGSRVWLPLAAAAVFFVVAGIAAASLTAGSPVAGVVAGAAAAVVGVASPVLYAGARVWNVVRAARTEGLRAIDEARDVRRQALVAEKAREAERSLEAERLVADARQRLKEAELELEKEKPESKLADFVSGRRASSDYRSRLGVIAQARGDFEQLTALLLRAQERWSNGERHPPDATPAVGGSPVATAAASPQDGAFLPNIERIVLFIDDLDRCNEKEVVAVLQAVNLLLAFPLFVVVVAVDPRWLVHSLRVGSRVFEAGGRAPGEDSLEPSDTEADAEWEATPLNYLEKIFQVPFAIKPMGEGGFQAMIDDLARSTAGTPETATESEGLGGDSGLGPGDSENGPLDVSRSTSGSTTEGRGERVEPADTSTGSPAPPAVLDASFLQISDAERTFMARLHPLITTPRAAKRFVNVYRLLKASASAPRRAAMDKTSEHEAILLLLAMLTGHPSETTVVLRRLIGTGRSGQWWPFVREVVASSVLAEPGTAGARLRNERWDVLQERLEEIERSVDNHSSLAPYVDWAPDIARFSFEASRVVVGQTGTPPPNGSGG